MNNNNNRQQPPSQLRRRRQYEDINTIFFDDDHSNIINNNNNNNKDNTNSSVLSPFNNTTNTLQSQPPADGTEETFWMDVGFPLLFLFVCFFMSCCASRGQVPGPEHRHGALIRRQAERVWEIERRKAARHDSTDDDRQELIASNVQTMKIIGKDSRTGYYQLGERHGIVHAEEVGGCCGHIESKRSNDTADTISLELDDDNDNENEDACDYECHICLDTFEIGDEVMFQKRRNSENNSIRCGHVFHRECITQWLLDHRENECPTCRTVFIDDHWNEKNKTIATDCDSNHNDDETTTSPSSSASSSSIHANSVIEVNTDNDDDDDSSTSTTMMIEIGLQIGESNSDDNSTDKNDNDNDTATTYYIAKGRIIAVRKNKSTEKDDEYNTINADDSNIEVVNTSSSLPLMQDQQRKSSTTTTKKLLSVPIPFQRISKSFELPSIFGRQKNQKKNGNNKNGTMNYSSLPTIDTAPPASSPPQSPMTTTTFDMSFGDDFSDSSSFDLDSPTNACSPSSSRIMSRRRSLSEGSITTPLSDDDDNNDNSTTIMVVEQLRSIPFLQ